MQIKRNKPRSPRSLVFTLTISLAIFSIVTLLIAQSTAFFLSRRTLNTSIANQQRSIAQEAGGTVASSIQEKFSVLETASEFGNPSTANVETRQTILDDLLGLQPAFRQLAILNVTGRQMTTVSRQSSSLSEQFESHLQGDVLAQTSEGQRYISPVYIDELTSEPLVAIAVPAQNVFGDFQGVLVAELNLKFMWDLVDQLQVGETGYAYVVDNQGNLIAFQDTARVLRGENVGQLAEVRDFMENPSATADINPEVATYTGLLGEDVVGTYLPLGTPPWAVVIEIPYEEAYRPGTVQGNISIATTIVLGFLAAILGRYIARRVAAPLIDLSAAASDIAAGNLSREAKVAGPAEIAQVAATFNTMTSQLRELIGSLEQRVADRTRALVTASQVSHRISSSIRMDRQRLSAEVVELVNSSFNFYHTQTYFIHPTENELVLEAATGEAGKAMLEKGHRIPMGRGLVGRAAETNTPVLVSDVSTDREWLPNPLLPETKSELAIPISAGEIVIGVLDVQQNIPQGLTEEHKDVLQTVANQIMIAAQNARLLMEAQRYADREALITTINQKIQNTTTVENALQVAVREVGLALGAHTSVRLAQLDQRTDTK